MAVTDPNTIIADSGLVNALYGTAGTAAQATANATADTTIATGDTIEGGMYSTAAGIASGNASIALASGKLQQFQNTRQYLMTAGAQRAGVAGGGFAQSGTALDLARSSLQQNLFQNQVTGVNSDLAAGGYFAQAQAQMAQAQAANTAAAGATANAAGATNIASLATAQNTVTGNFLNQIPGAAATINGVTNPRPTLGGFPGTGGGVTTNPLANLPGSQPGITLPGLGTVGGPATGTNTPTPAAPMPVSPMVI